MINPLKPWLENPRTRWTLLIAAGAILALAALALALSGTSSTSANLAGMPTFTVEPGPLTISVTETGTIKPLEQEVIKSKVEGQTTIIYLIPEGTLVKKGDLLVLLDSSKLQDDLLAQQIVYRNAESNYIRSREQLEMTRLQAEADVAKAELDYQFALEDLRNYQEGEFPQALKEAESKITIAEEQLKNASEKLRWSELLYAEKYISQTELEADRLAKQRAELDLELAIAARDLLKNFTYKRRLDELKANVEQTRLALERAKRKAAADIIQAEADLQAKQSEMERQKAKLDKIEEQISFTRITAPRDGMVVYATSTQVSWRPGSQEPLAEGQIVRERQDLIYLPTASVFMASVKIHESALQKVQVGMPVVITVDALPGRTYRGRVAKIAPLPDATSMWMNPDLKVYTTEIHIEGDQSELRTGMSCRAEIIVQELENVTYVPVQAVLRVGQQPTVWVVQGKQVVPRPVELGLDNNRMVHVISGLKPGEKVLLTPPLTEGAVALASAGNGQNANNLAAVNNGQTPASAGPSRTPEASVPAPRPPRSPQSPQAAAPRPSEPGAPERPSPQQIEEFRRRLESMSPEQRQQFMEQMRRRQRPEDAPASSAPSSGAGSP